MDVAKTLTFSVGPLVDQTTGTNETYSFHGPVKFEGIIPATDMKGRVEIMRIDEGFNVAIRNTEIKVKLSCEKCLKPITTTIKLDFFEKQFFLDEPKQPEDPNDLYLVDKKHLTINLAEPLRQEIILHFPVVQVCSESCKGICPKCGTDLNKKKCKCKIDPKNDRSDKPLAALKELIKK